MRPLFQTVTNLQDGAEVLRARPYGVIEMAGGRLVGVHLRPWPKLVSVPEASLLGEALHRYRPGDRCLLYYNQPRSSRNFLALKYMLAGRGSTFATCGGALVVLDHIARIKQTDAIVCEVTNRRITDRMLARWGWQSHVPQSRRRHFIKRFYGQHDAVAVADSGWATRASAGATTELITQLFRPDRT